MQTFAFEALSIEYIISQVSHELVFFVFLWLNVWLC